MIHGLWAGWKSLIFLNFGGPQDQSNRCGSKPPHLLERFLAPPGPPKPNKIDDFWPSPKPLHKAGHEAPRLVEWFLVPPGPSRPPNCMITLIRSWGYTSSRYPHPGPGPGTGCMRVRTLTRTHHVHVRTCISVAHMCLDIVSCYTSYHVSCN